MEDQPADPRVHAGPPAPRQRRAPGVFQPAPLGDPDPAREADGGMGRDPAPRSPQVDRGAVVAGAGKAPRARGAGGRQGSPGILSAGYYLDAMRPAESHYLVDPLPAGSGLVGDAAAGVLGGEACMWGVHITPETIDSRIWPRAAAIAERFWSPAEVRDVADMYRRLAVTRVRPDALGVRRAL